MPAKRATSSAALAEQVARYESIDASRSGSSGGGGSDGDAIERPKKLLLSVDDALRVLNYTRPRFYREVNKGRIETLKDGKRRLVPYGALKAYVRMLCEEQGLSPEVYRLVG